MRAIAVFLTGLAVVTNLAAQDTPEEKFITRYGVVSNFSKFPQDTPQKALASVIKAITDGRIDYLLAHLADPSFVDGRIEKLELQAPAATKKEARQLLAFEQLVKETTDHFLEDPTLVKELQRFAKEGEWQVDDKVATVRVKSLPIRSVFLRKMDKRWYFLDRQK
jgi:hypothetical protein